MQNDEENKKLLGLIIKTEREKLKLTQEELCSKIELDQSNLSNIENGKNYPSMTNLESILRVIECSFLEVFDFEHKKENGTLIEEINEVMKKNPEKIEDFYKIIKALTK